MPFKKHLPNPKCPPDSSAEAILKWCRGRLNPRSGYYAGRGVKTGDLNADMLEDIFDGIAKDFSPQHAEVFVKFVEKLKDMSATAFLVAFEYFFGRGCADADCYTQ